MESLKMLALGWCKKGTDEDGPTNRSDCLKYALHRKWKFAHIRGYLYPGTMFAPTQGA